MGEEYFEYFNNLKDFVFKKKIIEDISSTYGVVLSNDEYNKIIRFYLDKDIISKSTNSPGKCAYISKLFLDENNLDAISYYKSKKIESQNLTLLTKTTISTDSFIKDDCIKQVNLGELFNEL